MICISYHFLSLIGVTDITPGQFIAPDVYVSEFFRFGGLGSEAAETELTRQRQAGAPAELILVGMDDGDGAGERLASSVRTVSVSLDDDDRPECRAPTAQEASSILGALESGVVVGSLVPIVEALRRAAATATSIMDTTTTRIETTHATVEVDFGPRGSHSRADQICDGGLPWTVETADPDGLSPEDRRVADRIAAMPADDLPEGAEERLIERARREGRIP